MRGILIGQAGLARVVRWPPGGRPLGGAGQFDEPSQADAGMQGRGLERGGRHGDLGQVEGYRGGGGSCSHAAMCDRGSG